MIFKVGDRIRSLPTYPLRVVYRRDRCRRLHSSVMETRSTDKPTVQGLQFCKNIISFCTIMHCLIHERQLIGTAQIKIIRGANSRYSNSIVQANFILYKLIDQLYQLIYQYNDNNIMFQIFFFRMTTCKCNILQLMSSEQTPGIFSLFRRSFLNVI